MVVHLDVNDERYPDAAERILQRHDLNEPEANITSAIRDFLILTNLARERRDRRGDVRQRSALGRRST